MKKILITVASAIMFLAMLSPTTALAAAPVIINGSFETGDYTGWTLWEGNPDNWPERGTWGIASDGEVINPDDSTYDFHDGIWVTQKSPGLPITYVTTDGEYLAYQLQAGKQDHRMYQDVTLPASATTLSWDMFYTNHYESGFNGSQYLAVHIRDLNDNVLETLFKTEAGDPQSIPMTHFACDICAYAGSTVRVDVEMVVQNKPLDAGFDNFVIDQDEYTITATAGTGGTISPEGEVTVNHGDNQTFTIIPDAGYHIEDVLVDGTTSAGDVGSYTFTSVEANHTIYATFAIDTTDTTDPPGWAKESKEGWNGSVPPGLENKGKTPPGFGKGNKTGWK